MKNAPLRSIALLGLCFLMLPLHADQVVDRGAKLKFFLGKVLVKSADSKEWIPVKLGQKLRSKDALRTFVESKAEIETPEGTVVTLSENTVFELAELSQNARTKAENTKLEIKSGSVWANVKKLTNRRSSFVFETPTATAAIRGTELGLDVTNGQTTITLRDGKVEVQSHSGGSPVMLYQNQQATVKENDPNVTVEPIKSSGGDTTGLLLEILSPGQGTEVADEKLEITGKTSPGASVKLSTGEEVKPQSDGSFTATLAFAEGVTGDQEVTLTAIFEGKTVTKTLKFVKVKAKEKPAKDSAAAGCQVELTEPQNGAEVGTTFSVKGTVDNPQAIVKVNGQAAMVSGNAFIATVNTGFTAGQAQPLTLMVTSPANGAEILKLPVVIRGKVTPPLARVLLDGNKEARVLSDGSFEAEYSIPDESGRYDVEVSAVLEAGETVKKKFDVVVEAECQGVKPAPVKTTVSVSLGESKQSGEKKVPLSFNYKKPKYTMILTASAAKCVGDKIVVDLTTNAVALRANDKVVPLSGAGGAVRGVKYEVANTDAACLAEDEITFTAVDESAEPESKEITVPVSCVLLNTYKPELRLEHSPSCLSIKVFDKSFGCAKADEEVHVTVSTPNEGQIEEFDVASNGSGQCMPLLEGVNLNYRVVAMDKGKNVSEKFLLVPGFMSRQPRVRLLNPPTPAFTKVFKVSPPPPPGGNDRTDEEIPISFRIEDVENYKLIKRVEFSVDGGSKSIVEGASIPTDLEFDDHFILRYNAAEINRTRTSKTFAYLIRIIDILGREKLFNGTVTIQPR